MEFRGRLYFPAIREDGWRQLWKSDGTDAGTIVVAEFPPLSRYWDSPLLSLTSTGRQLFFTLADDAHGSELWVSDGTGGGTRLVADLTPGPGNSTLGPLVAVGGRLFFFRAAGAETGEPRRTELWMSDGTATGTVRVRDFGPRTSARFDRVIARGDTLFFILSRSDGTYELWKSDGSGAGTLRLRTFDPPPLAYPPYSLRVAGRFVYFIADESAHGSELWRTDGTVAGTELFEDFTPGPAGSFPQLLDVARGRLFFTVRDSDRAVERLFAVKVGGCGHCEPKLVTSLPNPFAGRREVYSRITASATTGEKFFFSQAFYSRGPAPIHHRLWVTDGTESGTTLLHQALHRSDEYTTELFAVDGLLLFPANIGEFGNTEPWVSDGTVRGTRLLQDIIPGPRGSIPYAFTRVNDRVFFLASHGDVTYTLWVVYLRRQRPCPGAPLITDAN
ncbi:hypothetical protein [Cystobacter ferrugineus]|uniref:hypothetical protein n=1 Tax=Cystobacter ferrugineus TaxID=83449 RepID=UPI0016518CD6|nr:hypothetical protein [Cystobacter ferrugineus]